MEPFGRPLLTFIAREISRKAPHRIVRLPYFCRIAMRIWLGLLRRNRGLRYSYILNTLPIEQRRMYVDAASTGGIGGYASYSYFSVPLAQLGPALHACDGWSAFPRVDIAWLELFAAFVAIDLFAADSPGHLLILYSDNTNVVAWLSRRRPPNPYVCALVAAIERLKYKFMLKLSVRYIPSSHNVSADLLSRNSIPRRFLRHGTRIYPNLFRLTSQLMLSSMYKHWSQTIISASLPL